MNLRNQGDLQELNSTLAWIYVTKVIYKGYILLWQEST